MSPCHFNAFCLQVYIFYREKLPRLYDGMVTELEVKAYNGIRSNPSVANCSICFWVDKEKNTYLCFFVHYIDRQWLPHTILLKFQCLASNPIDTFNKELGNMLKSNFVAISQRNLCDTDEPD